MDDLEPVVDTHHLTVLSNKPLQTWQSVSDRGWYWSPIDRSARPHSWLETQNEAMAPGVAHLPDGARLHNDLLGMHQLFYSPVQDSIVFSNWMPLLVEISGARRTDAIAWVSILLLGYPTPGRSQFQEIKSLPPCSSLRWVANSFCIEESQAPPIGNAEDPRDLLDALRASIPETRDRAVYTLSGGWDSRLLTGLASQSEREIETWTTHAKAPREPDTIIAAEVAALLLTHHRLITPDIQEQIEAMDTALRRFHYSTWRHDWLESLAGTARRERSAVVDGLAGDVLLKGLHQLVEHDCAGTDRASRLALWERLGGRNSYREDVWSDEALALFRDSAFDDFDETIRPFVTGSTWQTMAVLTTRTARTIALSPMRLFGPELEVFLPFLTRQALEVALSPAIHQARGGGLYSKILEIVDPRLSAIRSTNDDPVKSQVRAISPTYHSSTLERIAATVTNEDSAIRLLNPRLTRLMRDRNIGGLTEAMTNTGAERAIRGVYAYASWLKASPQVEGGLLA